MALTRSYLGMDETWFEGCTKPYEFKKLLFGLCFFHGMVLERRGFGPVGWNVAYGFSEPDRDISMKQLRNFLDEFEGVPYAALNYMVACANYGGRVTDTQDALCIKEIITDFYTPRILDEEYKFSISGIYYSPKPGTIAETLEFIKSLPLNTTPEAFWLHNNATLTAAINECMHVLKTAVIMMASFGGGGAADDEDEGPKKTDEEKFSDIATELAAMLPPKCDIAAVQRKYPVKYEQCLNTVLAMELGKFNKLLGKITDTLVNLVKAVKGLVVFSPELESVGNGCLTNTIPAPWMGVSYPSLKPMMSYVMDHLDRWKFMQDWIKMGIPTNFWFSAYFFQQAFLTGVTQNFARQDKIAIDKIMWNFRVMKKADPCDESPERGAYCYGLFMNGARWDDDAGVIADSFPKVLWDTFPSLWLRPVEVDNDEHVYEKMYACRTYKTSERKGVLSTSGHSSNFIMFMYLPCADGQNETFWTKRGVAFISQTDD